MLANIVQSDDNDNQNLSDATLSGWTLVAGREFGNVGSDSWWGTVLYKVATAADVAATNFIFAGDNDADDIEGGIAAFSGVAITGGVAGGPFDVAPGTINITNSDDLSATGITTTTANAAVIMFGMIGQNRNVDAWTATSPTTFTEIFDVPFNAGLDMGMGMAWALKAAAGATGVGAGELSSTGNDTNGSILIALRPCTASPTITTTGTATAVCFSASAQTTVMPYTATTNSPTSYSIDWNAAANTAGLLDQTTTAITFVSGAGSMSNIAIPASVAAGTYNGTVTISSASGCLATQAISLIISGPIVSAGSALTAICQAGTSAALGGSVSGSATGGTWSTISGGTFTSGATNLNTTWSPPPGFSGTATLVLTTSGGSCGIATAQKTINVSGQPVATGSGQSQTTCVGIGATVSGMTGSPGGIQWIHNGSGTLTNSTTLTPTYTPGAGDSGLTRTLTMNVTNSPCVAAQATYTVIVPPNKPAAAGTITGSASVCAGGTSLSYSVAAVTNATNYAWTVPSGWTINSGNGTTSITATAGSAGTGNVTVVASNSCGSTDVQTVISIFPVNAANNTGFVTSTVKTSDGIQNNNGAGERRGIIKFPLTAIPTGATIISSSLRLTNNNSTQLSTNDNDVRPLGNLDPVTTAAAALFTAIGTAGSGAVGTVYSRINWSNTGSITLALGSNATADIQSRFASPGYIAMGLARDGSFVYNFFGYSGGANAPRLDVTYSSSAPRALAVTVNPLTTNGDVTTSICAGATYVWPANGTSYTTAQSGTTFVSGCNTATLNLTINPLTTNGDVTTSICAGATYVWPANGTSYTTTQSGTTFVSVCNTATLNLTVTPLTTTGSVTTSICAGDSYTWPANSTSYTTSQSGITVVSVCNTATLNLTVTPLTTTGSVTTSICDGATYIWPATGASYTTAQSGITVVSVCNTATLNLTITPTTTTGSVTTTICDGATYIWPANGSSYTTTQSGTTFVDECNTATLNLTVTPNTTTGSVTTSICDGQTYVWPANGASYTTAQSGVTVVDECNTATLNLTITPLTTTGSESVTACGLSYLWAVNGVSYSSSGTYGYVQGCNTATLILVLNTAPQTFYADTDGDGFGTGPAIVSCTGQPANTSINNTDCAPGDGSIWRTANFFTDGDGDGFNNGFPSVPLCYGATTPTGFVGANNGVDCDDASASANPNASEVLGNSIDDNCDGVTDEVTETSHLNTFNCGITLTNLVNTLYAYDLATFVPILGPIQGYRFRVTNGATVRTFDSPNVRFNLMNLPGGATYATTYTVEVSAKSGGFFRAYGTPCTVTTPSVPNATFVVNPICGTTLNDISNSIFCQRVPTASGYRFRVSNGATIIGTVNSSTNRFSLVSLGISNLDFATTYTIDVLLAFGGNFRPDSEYGPTCTITTPATPGTSRVINPTCGTTINALWTTIYAQQIIGAQGYKFVVTNGAQTREFITANPRLQLPLLPGGASANTSYTIRVDVLYNSSYVVGTVMCTLTTSPTATRQTNAVVSIYEVNAYPNPYAETFKLNINTSSEDQVGVRVYDMLGREVEARQGDLDNLTNLEIGSQYPSGVYNIVVTQGNKTKTIRVIKR